MALISGLTHPLPTSPVKGEVPPGGWGETVPKYAVVTRWVGSIEAPTNAVSSRRRPGSISSWRHSRKVDRPDYLAAGPESQDGPRPAPG